MIPCKFRTAGNTRALEYAAAVLQRMGWAYSESANLLLLPVPSFEPDGSLKGGGSIDDVITDETVVFGGNLKHNSLAHTRCADLLQDPIYLAENAAITAHCALKYALERLPVTFSGCPVLITGWGRIGKHLSFLLKQMGADVTVSARRDMDRAMAQAFGYRTVTTPLSDPRLHRYRVIFNTVPAMLLPSGTLMPEQIKIDLASSPGIEGSDVIWARGLPGKDAPESSGNLIAHTVDRLRKEFLL